MGALLDFQEAIYDQLTGDATLVDLVGSTDQIADWPKSETRYPLVTIGEDLQNQWGMKDEALNFQVGAVIHVWTSERGWSEAKEIIDRIDVLLLKEPATLR
jgi:hypothetical protein